MEIREQLQRTLGCAYTLERELGGGGMSGLPYYTMPYVDGRIRRLSDNERPPS